jgi:hypothetical protein
MLFRPQNQEECDGLGHMARMAAKWNKSKISVGRKNRKETTLKTERKRDDNIKKILKKETGIKSKDWTDLAKDKCRVVV